MSQSLYFATPVDATENNQEIGILAQMSNRHGCVSGATGTGKTVSLQKLAENFSKIGVPVFLADIKGDLSGLAKAGQPSEKLKLRMQKHSIKEPVWESCPVCFWDVFGEQGHRIRATVSDMGPLLLSRLLNLNDTQAGVLNVVFSVADDQGLLLLDLKDLRSLLQYVSDNAKVFKAKYGNISSASVGAIQRGLLTLEKQGGDKFFGEPMLDIYDLMQTSGGKGVINIVAADKLMGSPLLYGTFLLWVLSEIYENLPEAGDIDKPKLVFFFDEAHLLFNNASPVLVDKIEQIVRLVRSKGVGVFFVSQSPADIPDKILAQLGNRVQHALRAFTPKDQKAIKTTAETMRPNPKLDIADAIMNLGVGEAVVSFLDANGTPSMSQRCWVGAPGSQIGPISTEERKSMIAASRFGRKYDTTIDRESAYEVLQKRALGESESAREEPARQSEQSSGGARTTRTSAPRTSAQRTAQRQSQTEAVEEETSFGDEVLTSMKEILFGSTGPRGGRKEGMVETMTKTAVRQAGTKILRGILGSILGGKK